MLKLAKIFRLRRNTSRNSGYVFSHPLVLLQSDDWGRVGLRDREGLESLRAAGVEFGENPYDLYTLETSEDIAALGDMLRRHHDSTGRLPCIVANFILANLDFARMASENFRKIHWLPLTAGLPGKWSRPGLFEAYHQAITEGWFYPGLHGLTHFCQPAVEYALLQHEDRAALLRTLWQVETPYIYWRMPWIGYEYCQAENPTKGFLSAGLQASLIRQAADIFRALFSLPPVSACAPGYRANRDTRRSWRDCGVRVAQNGPGSSVFPYMDEHGLLTLTRTLDFEPSQAEPSLESCMSVAEETLRRGAPLIVSIHSINFHSTVKNFRDPSLRALDRFLSALEARHPDLLYVHDADLYDIVSKGRFTSAQGSVPVTARRENETPAAVSQVAN